MAFRYVTPFINGVTKCSYPIKEKNESLNFVSLAYENHIVTVQHFSWRRSPEDPWSGSSNASGWMTIFRVGNLTNPLWVNARSTSQREQVVCSWEGNLRMQA